MATQHPDNASAPYWAPNDPFISTNQEVEEAARMFKELDCKEYMWDWEGKHVDEAVIEKLFQTELEYFKKHQLGKDHFLTFRLPNIWQEKGYRIARAFMSILTANDIASDLGLHTPPIFEVILPMTESADQLMHLQHLFQKLSRFKHEVFDDDRRISSAPSMLKRKKSGKHNHLINVIPLFEDVNGMINAGKILEEYAKAMKKEYNTSLTSIRPFIARSDPAMNSSLIPSVLSVKAAIAQYHAFSANSGILVFPWVGGGSLPFRGGVNPENIDFVIDEYRGAASLTIQSAFRYDYPFDLVKEAINKMNDRLPKNLKKFIPFSANDIKRTLNLNTYFSGTFRKNIEGIATEINTIAENVPRRRERLQHIGIWGYSRGVGKVRLPRAIGFTAALYSLGIPPELIATGRGLAQAKEKGDLAFIKERYLNLERDLMHAGHYFNPENLEILISKNKAWKPLKEDIEQIQKTLGFEFGPASPHHYIHRNLTSTILQKWNIGENFDAELVEAAKVRKSLG